MKISTQKTYAVITGDIVGSSKLPKAKRQALPELLQQASRETRKAFPQAVPLDAAIFRGDGWQLFVADPALSLRIGLFFRGCLRSESPRGRGLDTRLAIALGTIDFLPGEKLSQGDGEAYRASGRALEKMPKKQRLVLVTPVERPDLSIIVRLIDALAQDWTGRRAGALLGALRGWTQEKIAQSSAGSVTQATVVGHLEGAHWNALEAALLYVENNVSPKP